MNYKLAAAKLNQFSEDMMFLRVKAGTYDKEDRQTFLSRAIEEGFCNPDQHSAYGEFRIKRMMFNKAK